MGPEVKHHFLLTTAENPGVCQSREAGADLDGTATGIVDDAPSVTPSTGIPRPAGDWAVHEGRPEEDENHCRNETTTFRDGSDGDGRRGGAELHLR